MTVEQAEKLIAIGERIAAALEKSAVRNEPPKPAAKPSAAKSNP